MVGLSRVRLKIGGVASWIEVSIDEIKAAERKGIIVTRQSRGEQRRYTFKQAERLNHYFLFKDRMRVLRQAAESNDKAQVFHYNEELEDRIWSCPQEKSKADEDRFSLEVKANELRRANSSLRARLSRERNERQKMLLTNIGLPSTYQARKLGKMIVRASGILSALPLVDRKRSARKLLGRLAKETENLEQAAAECRRIFKYLRTEVESEVRSKHLPYRLPQIREG